MSKRLVSRRRDGRFDIRLGSDERSVLGAVLGELRELIVEPDDPSLRRLFPPAYPDDDRRQNEYQVLTHDELLDRRLAAIDVVEASLRSDVLDEEQLMAWMSAVNDLRLVLGTRLDVAEDMDFPEAGDPTAPAFGLYHFLSYVLAELVDAAGA
jgi:hypothetical protein